MISVLEIEYYTISLLLSFNSPSSLFLVQNPILGLHKQGVSELTHCTIVFFCLLCEVVSSLVEGVVGVSNFLGYLCDMFIPFKFFIQIYSYQFERSFITFTPYSFDAFIVDLYQICFWMLVLNSMYRVLEGFRFNLLSRNHVLTFTCV